MTSEMITDTGVTARYLRKMGSVIPAQNQIRHTRAKSDPSHPRKIRSVTPAQTRSVIPALAAGISPR